MLPILLLATVPAQLPTPQWTDSQVVEKVSQMDARLSNLEAILSRLEQRVVAPQPTYSTPVRAKCNPDCGCGCQQGQPCRCIHVPLGQPLPMNQIVPQAQPAVPKMILLPPPSTRVSYLPVAPPPRPMAFQPRAMAAPATGYSPGCST